MITQQYDAPSPCAARMDNKPNIGEFWTRSATPQGPACDAAGDIAIGVHARIAEGRRSSKQGKSASNQTCRGPGKKSVRDRRHGERCIDLRQLRELILHLLEIGSRGATDGEGHFQFWRIGAGRVYVAGAAGRFITLDLAIACPGHGTQCLRCESHRLSQGRLICQFI